MLLYQQRCTATSRVIVEEKVTVAKDFDEARKIANSVPYGLSASIYTNNLNKAFRLTDMIEVGMIHINSSTLGGEVQLRFGGSRCLEGALENREERQ